MVSLDELPDQCSSFFEDEEHKLLSRVIYRTTTSGDHVCSSYKFVWANFAQPRVKFFGWLLTQNRIQCRSSLVRKHIVDDASCKIFGLEDETTDHIISGCNFVRSFWNRIGWAPEDIAKADELWLTRTPPNVHSSIAHPLILLYC